MSILRDWRRRLLGSTPRKDAPSVSLKPPAAAQASPPDALRWAVEGPPVGVWATAYGTSSVVMNDVLTLRPDGTGLLASWSALHGAEEIPIRWEHPEAGCLRIALLFPTEAGEEDEPDPWATVHYEATHIQNEAGGLTAVLREIGSEGFWPFQGPLQFIGNVT